MPRCERSRAVVVGAGVAGLTAAMRLRRAGADVTVVSKGIGGLQLSQGTIDVLGYAPRRVELPFDAFASLPADHPYHLIGPEAVLAGVRELAPYLGAENVDATARNLLLPTALGAWRPTCVAPESMRAGDLRAELHLVVVGIRQLKDFHALLIADNLQRSAPADAHVRARAVVLDWAPRPHEWDASGLTVARALDSPAAVDELAAQIRPLVREGETVAVPAVLGIRNPDVWRRLMDSLGSPVCEIPLPPPGVPGMRLNEVLVRDLRRVGVAFVHGAPATGVEQRDGGVTGVHVAMAGHDRTVPCEVAILAEGGLESGGITVDSRGVPHETLMDLPLRECGEPGEASGELGDLSDDLFRTGVLVDRSMRPVDRGGSVVLEGLFACGSMLAGAIGWDEKSGEGIAVGSAVRAAESALERLEISTTRADAQRAGGVQR